MGHIYIDLEIANLDDLTRASDGHITPNKIRRVKLYNVLVDSGATIMCLPAETIRELGLTRYKKEEVAIASGTMNVRTFQGVELSVNGRTTVTEVMELPEGSEPLLGAIPMQLLGMTLDFTNDTVQFLKRSRLRV